MSEEPKSAKPPEESGFSHQLEKIEAFVQGDRVTLADLEDLLQGRGFAMLILVLCLPFIQPIPFPGLSVPLGLAVALLGARLCVGKTGRLPKFLSRREFDPAKLRKVVGFARKGFSRVDRLFKRRLGVFIRPPLGRLMGVTCIASGLALSLPLPPVILLSNTIPAVSVILVCLGLLERDGLLVLLGHVIAVATWIYFGFWEEAVRQAIVHFWQKWT